MTLIYEDTRSDDRYEIYLIDREFDSAVRFIGLSGRDPIVYDSIESIPTPHRQEIEHRIWQFLHAK